MFNIIASAAILSIFFGFAVFYGNLKANIKNKDYSKEDAFKYARNDAIQAIKGLLGVSMLLIAVAVFTGSDKAFEAWLVNISPAWLTTLSTQF